MIYWWSHFVVCLIKSVKDKFRLFTASASRPVTTGSHSQQLFPEDYITIWSRGRWVNNWSQSTIRPGGVDHHLIPRLWQTIDPEAGVKWTVTQGPSDPQKKIIYMILWTFDNWLIKKKYRRRFIYWLVKKYVRLQFVWLIIIDISLILNWIVYMSNYCQSISWFEKNWYIACRYRAILHICQIVSTC